MIANAKKCGSLGTVLGHWCLLLAAQGVIENNGAVRTEVEVLCKTNLPGLDSKCHEGRSLAVWKSRRVLSVRKNVWVMPRCHEVSRRLGVFGAVCLIMKMSRSQARCGMLSMWKLCDSPVFPPLSILSHFR